jgi:hypothetical protein
MNINKGQTTMTNKKTINMKEYCNTLYAELDGMKSRLGMLVEQINNFQGEDREHVGSHADHLNEIIKAIDWKLEIIGKACPIDSTSFGKGAVGGASVPLEDPSERGKRVAGGNIGG